MKILFLTILIGILSVSCKEKNQEGKKGRPIKGIKDSISYSLGVSQAETMLKKTKIDARDFSQIDLINGFKENLHSRLIFDSVCKDQIALFIGKNGQNLNSNYAKKGSYCIGKFNAHNFLTIWTNSRGINRLNLKKVGEGFEDVISKKIIPITENRRNELVKNYYENLVDDITKIMIDSVKLKKNCIKIENDIYIQTIKKGIGSFPNDSAEVMFDIILTSPFNDTLDNTFKNFPNKKPPFFNIKRMYPGWSYAFPYLQKEGIYRVYMPFEMVEDSRLPFPYICFYIEIFDFK